MVEVMKIMATSFKTPPAHTATLSAPNPAAGHRPMPLLETPGHSWASLGRSLVGSLLLSRESLCAPGTRDPKETEPELCLSVSCDGMGQQWPAAGAGALVAADLDMA